MAASDGVKFESAVEELAYWKNRAEECQLELEEYQLSSKELELELETQLGQAEKESRELRQSNLKFQSERELLNEKYSTIIDELRSQNEKLDDDLSKEKQITERLNRIVRELVMLFCS